jgi:hypothetical protein
VAVPTGEAGHRKKSVILSEGFAKRRNEVSLSILSQNQKGNLQLPSVTDASQRKNWRLPLLFPKKDGAAYLVSSLHSD